MTASLLEASVPGFDRPLARQALAACDVERLGRAMAARHGVPFVG